LNEPVTAMRSIATDKSIFPRGALCFLEAPLPLDVAKDGQGVYRGFVLDQDAGGAIRAPGRCDVYMGVGEEAGELAGHTWAEGRLYYLILKPEEHVARR
jgi:membrane-bound lytic murein transglycosylase A